MSSMYRIEFTRSLKQYRNASSLITEQVKGICEKALRGVRGDGFKCRIIVLPEDMEPVQDGENWSYHRSVEFSTTIENENRAKAKFAKIVTYIREQGCSYGNFKQNPWEISGPGIETAEEGMNCDDPEVKLRHYSPISPADIKICLPEDEAEWFSDFYNREAQIQIIMSSLREAQETKFQNRNHCVLYGPPGSAKTTLLLRFAEMVGVEGEAYLKIDGPSATGAGVKKMFLEDFDPDTVLPPILIVEEIEKVPTKHLSWLLGVMDTRGEIRKTTNQINIARQAKLLVLATANNPNKLKAVMDGALHSRFAMEIPCPRPTVSEIEKILSREIRKKYKIENLSSQHERWIESTINFCCSVEKERFYNYDPRKIIPVCLCGGDKLLNGEYQRCLDKIHEQHGERENEE